MTGDSKNELQIVPVLVPMPAERGYSYLVPKGADGRAGFNRAGAARATPGLWRRLGWNNGFC